MTTSPATVVGARAMVAGARVATEVPATRWGVTADSPVRSAMQACVRSAMLARAQSAMRARVRSAMPARVQSAMEAEVAAQAAATLREGVAAAA